MPDLPDNSSTTAVIRGTGDYRSSLELNQDVDWWRVDLIAGRTYDFYLSGDGTGTAIDGRLTLRDDLGGSIAYESDGNWLSYTATSTGTFYLAVSDTNQYDDAAEGPYVIRAQMGDNIVANSTTTATITRSGTTTGTLEANTDSDWYRVQLVAGQTVGFSVTPNGSLSFNDAYVRIRDQFGNVLDYASDGASNMATAVIATSGTYFIEVVDSNPYDDAAEGAYALVSHISDNAANNNTTTSRLNDGGSVRGAIDAYGDSDWHAFTAVAGRTYTFTMTGTGATGSLATMDLVLRNASGTSLASDGGSTSSGGAVITWTATTGGTYYLDANYDDYSNNIGNYALSVISNSPVIQGTSASEVLNGGANANTIRGGLGADWIFGNDGNDTLYGEAGNDTLNGGNGNDLLIGGLGDDVLNGALGIDTVTYAGGIAVTVDLTKSAAQDTGHGMDQLISIENVIGGNGNDRLTGNLAANALTGGAGNDVLIGNGGNDTLNGGLGNDTLNGGVGIDTVLYLGTGAVSVNLGLAAAQATGQGTDTLVAIENVTSGSGNDRLTGSLAQNLLFAGAGNDTLLGMGGNDTLNGGAGNDLIDGGAGFDTVAFTSTTPIRVNLGLTAAQNTGQGMDTIRNVENVIGGNGADVIVGDGGANNLQGGLGNDTLNGGAGSDVLIGGLGDDRLIGGLGNDTLNGGGGADRFVFDRLQGSDRIIGWEDGLDVIEIGSGAESYTDLAIRQVGQDTQISFSGTTITLAGISVWYVGASDFVFT